MKAKTRQIELSLRFQTVFFNDWSTGFGRGEKRAFWRDTLLIVTERQRKGAIREGDRVRVKVANAPEWQAYVEFGLDAAF